MVPRRTKKISVQLEVGKREKSGAGLCWRFTCFRTFAIVSGETSLEKKG